MNTKVIWFNHWFSAIINTVEAIKKAFPDVKIIGSNRLDTCVYKYAVDEFYIEPTGLSGDEYTEFALNFCKEHSVDIFFVKAGMSGIAKYKEKFTDIGTTVICEDISVLNAFDSKSGIYNQLEKMGYKYNPDYYIVNSADEFIEAANKIRDNGDGVCIKYDTDEGANSFRIVTDGFINPKHLDEPSMNLLSFDNAEKILRSAERSGTFKPIIVMPYLNGPEVSVDCLMTANHGLVTLPRYKVGSRIKEVKLTKELMDDCVELNKIFDFKYIFNAQYRWTKDGKPKLLEINPRISGGLHLTSMCGFNLVIELISDILGVKSNQSLSDIKECKVTQYETPVLLD